MDINQYRQTFFTNPEPTQRYAFESLDAITLYFENYEAALGYYMTVFGPPAYKEGEFIHGWRIGTGWLTMIKGTSGSHRNVEMTIIVKNQVEADGLQQAFIEAGGKGTPAVDTMMYEPVHVCPVTDPFGTEIMIFARKS